MSKIKLGISSIKKGMYVCELDRPWSDTPFLFQGFRVTNDREIEMLKKTCEYFYIDEEKSTVDVDPNLIVLSQENKTKKYNKPEPLYTIQVKHEPYEEKFENEFPVAKAAYHNSFEKMNAVFNDLRLGNSLDTITVKSTVKNMADSILRNPDALKLLCVLQERDDNAVTHALHVCILSLAFANYLGLNKDMIINLGIGGLLHDIGETRLPEGLFWKSRHYNEKEKKEIQKHTEYGVEIVTNANGLDSVVLDIVRDHHERLNCTGFPNQSCGDEISYNAMMVSIVDVYDSVTMGYEGKEMVSCTDALKSMYDWRNELFQGELVEHFIQCLGIYPVGSVVMLNSNEIGIVVTFDEASRLAPRIMLLLDKDHKHFSAPKIIDLSKFKDGDDKYLYEIKRVVKAEDYGIDIKQHILEGLYTNQVVNQ
jgi:putative nucleotidyltransferase with HDIG domain